MSAFVPVGYAAVSAKRHSAYRVAVWLIADDLNQRIAPIEATARRCHILTACAERGWKKSRLADLTKQDQMQVTRHLANERRWAQIQRGYSPILDARSQRAALRSQLATALFSRRAWLLMILARADDRFFAAAAGSLVLALEQLSE